jgi:hypothetical protein
MRTLMHIRQPVSAFAIVLMGGIAAGAAGRNEVTWRCD